MPDVLAGIRVADFTSMMAGPSAATLLADLGADVVKVETVTGGDDARSLLPYLFQSVNRNKRSLAVDLRAPGGLAVARRLVEASDVMLDGFRPGALASLGLGAAELRAAHPRLVHVSLVGFGSTGPGAGKRGIDQLIQAETGMADVMGGVNQRLGLVDATAGIALANAVLASLLRRERGGIGSTVEVTLYDTALWLQMLPIAEFSATRQRALQPDEYSLRIPTMGTFRVGDGEVFVAVVNDRDWRALCSIIGRADLADDPRFADRESRRAHGALVRDALAAALTSCELGSFVAAADTAGLMVAEIKDYATVLDDEQAAANGSFRELVAENGSVVTHTRGPYRFSDDDVSPWHRPPSLGEHTTTVLVELGYSRGEIAELLDAGSVRCDRVPTELPSHSQETDHG